MRKILCLITIFFAVVMGHGSITQSNTAASMALARTHLETFRKQAGNGRPDAMGYQALYNAAKIFIDIADCSTFGSHDYIESKQSLIEIYPRLADGAYYYASLNDQEKVLEFACSYIDVSLLKCMDSEHFQSSPQYATLANLAATNLYNRRQYDKSIRYFSAYLESGDLNAQENAFEGLARCYFETKQYGYAGSICFQGSQRYPRNMNLLLIGIESCGHNGNDTEMEPMLLKALALQPDHKGLLEYQGKMYERMTRFEDAAGSFSKLCSLNPTNLDYTCHLGFNYYNAATLSYTAAVNKGASTAKASDLFKQAAPLLRAVLDNSPYAANVARALAICYSLTNDATRLTEANKTLASLHSPIVDIKALPTIVQNYNPSPELNPVSPSTTKSIAAGDDIFLSDVDINIPETGLHRPDTYAVIIANENYKNAEVQTVPFAHRDGNMFSEYCNKVLGIPKDNIKISKDATSSEIRSILRYIGDRTDMEPGKLNIIFYFAGHGNPDIPNNKSYLVPADVRANDFEECLALDQLYNRFDALQARSVTVFLDACFSGATRDGKMMMSGRYVRKAQADVKPAGKTIVFSASSGEEAANAYHEQKHGYFTYYLLKALQETRGNITYAELRDRLRHDVQVKAFDLENKKQTPSFTCPDALISSMTTRKLND